MPWCSKIVALGFVHCKVYTCKDAWARCYDRDQSPHAQLSPFYRLSTQNVIHVILEPRLSPSFFHTVSDKNLRRGKAGYEARNYARYYIIVRDCDFKLADMTARV